jgi:hypothetical protein
MNAKATFKITETAIPTGVKPQEFFREILMTICKNHPTVSVTITNVESLFPEQSLN